MTFFFFFFFIEKNVIDVAVNDWSLYGIIRYCFSFRFFHLKERKTHLQLLFFFSLLLSHSPNMSTSSPTRHLSLTSLKVSLLPHTILSSSSFSPFSSFSSFFSFSSFTVIHSPSPCTLLPLPGELFSFSFSLSSSFSSSFTKRNTNFLSCPL